MPANEVMVRVDSVPQSEWEGMLQAGAAQKLPNAKTTDSGKVVSVNGSGKYVLSDGGGGGSETITATLDTTEDTVALSKTWKYLHDGMAQGKTFIVHQEADQSFGLPEMYAPVISIHKYPESEVYEVLDGKNETYVTDDENGYPGYGLG